MKKVLILFLLLIMLTSSLVFANSYGIPDTYLQQFSHWVVVKGSNGLDQVYFSNSDIYLSPSGYINTDGTSRSRKQVGYWTSELGWANNTFIINSFYETTHDIYQGTTLVFQSPKIPPLIQGMAGALQKLLSPIQLILPIILGMLVLAIGFHKAFKVLFHSLRGV
ncbi:hypothetical protein [Fusibacter bizertensis]